MNREIDHYRSLPYHRTVEFVEDESGRYYLAGILEIPGIGGDGDTPEAALRDLDAAFEAYVSVCLEDGLDIPEPAEPRTVTRGR
jgi:predicted RNase H-like HicB family nuclease